MKSSTSAASRPAMRIRSSSSAVFRTTAISLIMLEFRARLRCSKRLSEANYPARRIRVLRLETYAEVLQRAADLTLRRESVGHDASNAGGRRAFRPPDALLEPEDGP